MRGRASITEPLLLLCLTANKINSFTFTAGASPQGFLCTLHVLLFYFTMFYLSGKRLCVVSLLVAVAKRKKASNSPSGTVKAALNLPNRAAASWLRSMDF